jgi:hypothetical protein
VQQLRVLRGDRAVLGALLDQVPHVELGDQLGILLRTRREELVDQPAHPVQRERERRE